MDKFDAVHLGNIVVYSKSLDEYVSYLQKILELLHEHKLFAKWSKCLGAEQTEYLGHIVSEAGVAPDATKVSGV